MTREEREMELWVSEYQRSAATMVACTAKDEADYALKAFREAFPGPHDDVRYAAKPESLDE